MGKDSRKKLRDFIVKNCRIVFPVLVVILAAVTVVIAMNANRTKEQPENPEQSAESSEPQEEEQTEVRLSASEVPLVANEDSDIYTLVATYYNAIGTGETDTLQSICRGITENMLLYYGELSQYIDHYSDIEIYSKQGPEDGATIVYVYYKMGIVDYGELPAYETLYVCTDDSGQLFIKDESTFSEEEVAYIRTANEQVDVVEFNNRINVEYNELIEENPSLLEYVGLLSTQLKTKVGEILSNQAAENSGTYGTEENGEAGVQDGVSDPGQTEPEQPAETPVETGPQYATAATTVNVRSSDSEKADKLGKVTGGTRVEVQEVRVNGWTKILYEGKDGYIKSEYLLLEESAAGLAAIGTVTATTTVNVRASADESGEKLGMLAGGSSLDLLEEVNGWCKVNYNGQVGYVKSDYVTKQ